ncbi:hypothetical protein TRSC58_06297 [Trypanosoma rangeli SC58]|uniref:MORN repeat-containing protein 5 n=1 Tax=Trypanosoma rangeli SC58 TaxID=429131 RepID=A0A061IVC2_TRYRA|nr:hypothetical protein TRSC58_06297 [Trypanosoma rangeli SC58]
MFYTGCSYRGETTPDGKRFHGQGVYTFANGDTYVGAFKDGRMHGHGTLFFTAEKGGGQYRGVWEDGRNLSGALVFSDGLVYGSGENTSTVHATAVNNSISLTDTPKPEVKRSVDEGATPAMDSDRRSNAREKLAEEWLYCREGDRRLWAEHLREVMPVLPMQSVLGGVRVPQSSRWTAEPVVAPSVAAEAKIPATFVLGQPRSLAEIPTRFWEEPQQREAVIASMELPTPPFKGAQAGAGREETMVDNGGKPAINLSLRIIAPLESEAMRRAIAAAVSASESATKALQKRSSPSPQPLTSPDNTVHNEVGHLLAPSETDAVGDKTVTTEMTLGSRPIHVPDELKASLALTDESQQDDVCHTPRKLSSRTSTVARCPSALPSSVLFASHGPLAAESKDQTCKTLEDTAHKVTSEAPVEDDVPSLNVEAIMTASLGQQESKQDVKRQDELQEQEYEEKEDAHGEEHQQREEAHPVGTGGP